VSSVACPHRVHARLVLNHRAGTPVSWPFPPVTVEWLSFIHPARSRIDLGFSQRQRVSRFERHSTGGHDRLLCTPVCATHKSCRRCLRSYHQILRNQRTWPRRQPGGPCRSLRIHVGGARLRSRHKHKKKLPWRLSQVRQCTPLEF